MGEEGTGDKGRAKHERGGKETRKSELVVGSFLPLPSAWRTDKQSDRIADEDVRDSTKQPDRTIATNSSSQLSAKGALDLRLHRSGS